MVPLFLTYMRVVKSALPPPPWCTMDKSQHGFTKGKSTTTNLVEAPNVWTEALSHGIPIDVVYLDFAKAFNVVVHERLLNKVEAVGIKEKVKGCLKD